MLVELLAFGVAVQSATATPVPAGTPAASPSPAPFTLSVGRDGLASLTARGARAVDVARGLSSALGIPVRTSPLLARHVITVTLTGAPLESLVSALAPQAYVDYEVRWGRDDDWVAVELTGFNERESATPVQPRPFLLLAGSTEDQSVTPETLAAESSRRDEERLKDAPKAEGPVLDVAAADGLVSVRARKHMVTAVLLEVASKAGLGFETRGQLDEAFMDLDIRATPVDQLPAVIARPGFAVLMRKNLTAGSKRGVAMLLGTEATFVKRAAPSPSPVPAQRVR
jgi:hypothetical protein